MARSCASALALFSRPCFGWSVASVLPVWFSCRFSFRGAAGLLSFAAAVRFCGWLPSVFVCCFVCLGCVRFGSFVPCFPFRPPPLASPLCLLYS